MKIAIFDYDNTLSEGYSRYELAYEMEAIGMIKKGLRSEIEDLMIDYVEGRIGYNEKQAKDKKIFSKYYKGVNALEMQRFIRDDFNLEGLMYDYSKEIMQELKKREYMTVVISGCWDYIIEAAQEILDFDAYFSTSFKTKDGNLTGEYKKILDENDKRTISKELLLKADSSIGVGDSVADVEFLSQVDKGFLFEPNDDARKMVKDLKNVVIINRKDALETILDEAN